MSVPQGMKNIPNWVLHHTYVDETGKMHKKIPCNVINGKVCNVSSTNSSQWSSFEEILKNYEAFKNEVDGMGFVFTEEGGIVGIDLDNVRNPQTGEIIPFAAAIIKLMDSATEISPSGTGVHILIKAAGVKLMWNLKNMNEVSGFDPEKKVKIEMYAKAHFFTVTGNLIHGKEINERLFEVVELQTKYVEEIKIRPIRKSKKLKSMLELSHKDYLAEGLEKDKTFLSRWNGDREKGDESVDDFYLLIRLRYWCNDDPERMEAAFLSSPHTNTKDRTHMKKINRKDYLPRTISKVLNFFGGSRTAIEDDMKFQAQQERRAKRKKKEWWEPKELRMPRWL
jgi:putative DNA primase/helicase